MNSCGRGLALELVPSILCKVGMYSKDQCVSGEAKQGCIENSSGTDFAHVEVQISNKRKKETKKKKEKT